MHIPEPEWTHLWTALGNTCKLVGAWSFQKLKELAFVAAVLSVLFLVLAGPGIFANELKDRGHVTDNMAWVVALSIYAAEVVLLTLIGTIWEQYTKVKKAANGVNESPLHTYDFACDCEDCVVGNVPYQ